MSEVMIDLETLSTENNAVIMTIGAIKFDRTQKLSPLKDCETFYRRIEVDSCTKLGLHTSQDTLNWWNTQSKDAKYEIFTKEDRVCIERVLKEFIEWFGDSNLVWSHGSVFDCVILETAFKAAKINVPWKFWNVRDTRTLFDLGGVRGKDFQDNNVHHALHDCYNQIKGVKLALKNLKNPSKK